jgi:putative toxin-antitoxin system antitoxin component (TIGR02293 family)
MVYTYCMPVLELVDQSTEAVVEFKTRGASLGLRARDSGELIRRIERGLSFKALQSLEARSGLPLAVIAEVIGIPERTLARRKTAGTLAPEESERLVRLATIFEKAVQLFEGRVLEAVRWLMTPAKALDHHAPLSYARTELGGREVENLIGRLEHGVFS